MSNTNVFLYPEDCFEACLRSAADGRGKASSCQGIYPHEHSFDSIYPAGHWRRGWSRSPSGHWLVGLPGLVPVDWRFHLGRDLFTTDTPNGQERAREAGEHSIQSAGPLNICPFREPGEFSAGGVVLIVLAGYFSKGFIHFAVAKLFGPLIWGRGFCGWACWTAAILDWLPMKKKSTIPLRYRNLRFLLLGISIALPVYFVFALRYDVRGTYIGKAELGWMISSNIIYYLLAIPLAYWFQDRRAFCKVLCPVSLVMKVPARLARIRIRPSGKACTECGICNHSCLMDVDVMSAIRQGRKVDSTECVLCGTCKTRCPAGAIK